MNSVLPYFQLLRPRQWLKNLMLFFPPLFGGVLFEQAPWPDLLLPFLAFCLASSANYAYNDLLDADKDARHPRKKSRPIPSGAVGKPAAALLGGSLFALAILLGLRVSPPFLLALLAYLLVSSAYSFRLKDIAVVDIFCISAGFLLRLQAGGSAFGVPISQWLFLSVFLLSIFLSLGKRSAEKQLLEGDSAAHRPVLREYPLGFLHGSMYMTGGTVLVTYAMYVVIHPGLLYTVPLCCFGLFRFMFRVIKDASGDPTEALLQDKVLMAVSALWLVMVGFTLYLP